MRGYCTASTTEQAAAFGSNGHVGPVNLSASQAFLNIGFLHSSHRRFLCVLTIGVAVTTDTYPASLLLYVGTLKDIEPPFISPWMWLPPKHALMSRHPLLAEGSLSC